MNASIFVRILIAAIVVLALSVIIPAFLRILGFPGNEDVVLIIRVTIAVVALFYVINGPSFPWPTKNV